MSSEISTEKIRLKPDAMAESGSVRLQADGAGTGRLRADSGLQAWQFFVLAALGCATAVTFLVRGQGITAVILLTVLMGATVLVGMATLWTVGPLVWAREDRTVVIGHRTRAALEREKALTLRSIKELEFDRAMGKVSEEDFSEMAGKLRARATRLMKQLDASEGYRSIIERDLSKRLGDAKDVPADSSRAGTRPDLRTCAKCSTANDLDARFCKSCGEKM
jgi:hypothetical protein